MNYPPNRILRLAIAILALLTISACSTAPNTATNDNLAAPNPSAANPAPPPGAPGKVPASVVAVGDAAETLYDSVKANDWTKAASWLASLKQAAQKARADVPAAASVNDRLDSSIAALDTAVPKKDRATALREANQATAIGADLAQNFSPPVPVDVTRLDFYGRELEVWSVTRNLAKLKQTAQDLRTTWDRVRPAVASHGGGDVMKRFDALVKQVESAKTVKAYQAAATPVLAEVDNIEKVFTH